MSNTVYFGLALTAHNDGVLNTSTFDNMEFVGQVLQQPLNQEVQSGTNVTFTGLIFGAPLYYQWQFNGTNVTGAQSTAFTITNVQQFNAGNYALLATNLAGITATSNAVLTVDAPVTINTPTTKPERQHRRHRQFLGKRHGHQRRVDLSMAGGRQSHLRGHPTPAFPSPTRTLPTRAIIP